MDHPHGANAAASRRNSNISSLPGSSASLAQSQPPGYTSAAPGSSHNAASRGSSPHGSRPPLPQATESDSGSERSGASDHESDHSDTSTRATVPLSNPPPTAQSSTPPTTRGRGRQRGQRGGRGRLRGAASYDDGLGNEYYNLRESYDDEYDNPDPSWFDDSRSSSNEYSGSRATPTYRSHESIPAATDNSANGTASRSYISNSIAAEKDDLPRSRWPEAPSGSHPPTFQIRGGQYGWRPQRFQQVRPFVIQNKDGVWVRIKMTEEQYKFYMENHPPPRRKSKHHRSKYSSADEADQDSRQSREKTDKPDGRGTGSKDNGRRQGRQRSGRRSGYASDSESEDLAVSNFDESQNTESGLKSDGWIKDERHRRRKTHSQEHKKHHKPSHTKSKSKSKARYVPREPSPETSSSTSRNTRGRSPRPYARNGSRALRKATRVPDSTSGSSSDSDRYDSREEPQPP